MFRNRFYKDYITSGESILNRFYRKYQPVITDEHYTCVGLGFELLNRLTGLNKRFPGLVSSLYLVSCEEVSLFFIHPCPKNDYRDISSYIWIHYTENIINNKRLIVSKY